MNLLFKDFPGAPVVEDLPSKAVDVGLIPGWELRFYMLMGSSVCKQQLRPEAVREINTEIK